MFSTPRFVETRLAGPDKTAEDVDGLVGVFLSRGQVDDLLRSDGRVRQALSPTVDVFVVFAGQCESQFLQKLVAREAHRVLDAAQLRALIHCDLHERDVFVTVARRRQPQGRTAELGGDPDTFAPAVDPLLNPAGGVAMVARIVSAEETDLEEIFFEADQINSSRQRNQILVGWLGLPFLHVLFTTAGLDDVYETTMNKKNCEEL